MEETEGFVISFEPEKGCLTYNRTLNTSNIGLAYFNNETIWVDVDNKTLDLQTVNNKISKNIHCSLQLKEEVLLQFRFIKHST